MTDASDGLADELRELHRPWWRRWLRGGLLLGLLPAFPAHTQTSFEWALLCHQEVLHAIYDNDSNHEKLALEEYEGRENALDTIFIYRNGRLGRHITSSAEEADLSGDPPLMMEIVEWDSRGGLLAKNPVQKDGSVELWRIDLLSRQAWLAGISDLNGGGASAGFYVCEHVDIP